MKNILLISTGLSPQVITETLYYYNFVHKPSLTFSQIQVITEENGAKLIENELLSKDGKLDQYYNDYNINTEILDFDMSHVHIIVDEKGNPINDLTSLSDNNNTINQVFKIVQELTKDNNSRLFTNIAGGRKTMSVIVGQAMQFFGREQDRLIHVLIDDILFRSNDFYYPTPFKKILKVGDQNIDISKVEVNVNELPYVRLRPILGDIIGNSRSESLFELVKSAQQQIDDLLQPVEVHLDYKTKTILFNNHAIKLPGKNFSLYASFLSALKNNSGKDQDGYMDIDEIISRPFLTIYLKFYGMINSLKSALFIKENNRIDNDIELEKFFTSNWFMETKSKINRELKYQLPKNIYHNAMIDSKGPYGEKLYGISLDNKQIKL